MMKKALDAGWDINGKGYACQPEGDSMGPKKPMKIHALGFYKYSNYWDIAFSGEELRKIITWNSFTFCYEFSKICSWNVAINIRS